MTWTDEQAIRFYNDLNAGTKAANKDARIRWGRKYLENLTEAGYQIEFPTLRYRVEHYGSFYNIVDTEKDETAGCYSTRYFDNAEQMAQDFADFMNEAVEQHKVDIQDTTCSGGPVRNDDYIVKPHQRGWYVFHRDGTIKAGPFTNKTRAQDHALILNDAAYWRRVATREDTTTFLIYKGNNNRWFVYDHKLGPSKPIVSFKTMEQAQEYRDTLNADIGEGTGRW